MFGAIGSRLGRGLLVSRRAYRFPARMLPSLDPNVLDEYDENVWTPIVKFGGATTGITYGSPLLGKYTRIGRQVHLSGMVTLTSKGSATGVATVEGLPFVASNDAVYVAAAIGYAANMTSVTVMLGLLQPNSTRILLYQGNNGAAATLSNANFSNTSQFFFSATYDAA